MREDETADAPVQYELWSEAVEAPPRSRLYGLKPIGIGTSEVESLTCYINRLADAHLITATRLLKHELLPRVREEKSLDEEQIAIGEVWLRKYTIDSMGRRINGLSLTTDFIASNRQAAENGAAFIASPRTGVMASDR